MSDPEKKAPTAREVSKALDRLEKLFKAAEQQQPGGIVSDLVEIFEEEKDSRSIAVMLIAGGILARQFGADIDPTGAAAKIFTEARDDVATLHRFLIFGAAPDSAEALRRELTQTFAEAAEKAVKVLTPRLPPPPAPQNRAERRRKKKGPSRK